MRSGRVAGAARRSSSSAPRATSRAASSCPRSSASSARGCCPTSSRSSGFARGGVDRRGVPRPACATRSWRRRPTGEEEWARFAERLSYVGADFDGPEGFVDASRSASQALDRERGCRRQPPLLPRRPPGAIGLLADALGRAGLVHAPRTRSAGRRIVVEKPFGRDLESARELNARAALASSTRARSTGSTTTWGRRRSRTSSSSASPT